MATKLTPIQNKALQTAGVSATAVNHDLIDALLSAFKTLADPDRAVQQQRYAKSALPFAGLGMPVLRKTCRDVFKAHPPTTQEQWLATTACLWAGAQVREARYASVELTALPRFQKQWLDLNCVPLLEHMIRDGAWWDLVDALATNHMGKLLRQESAAVTDLLGHWLQDKDLWIRRTAILAQLKFKTDTDLDLLHRAIQGSIHDSDFFARKAIGWALREYSKTDAQWVQEYVERYRVKFAPLSIREALKIINKE